MIACVIRVWICTTKVVLEHKEYKQSTESLLPAMRALSGRGAALLAWSPVAHYPRRGAARAVVQAWARGTTSGAWSANGTPACFRPA